MARLRVLFVDEGIGGHRTMHAHLEAALRDQDEIVPTFAHTPGAGLARKLLAARFPGLDRLDLDFQPVRALLTAARATRRMVQPLVAEADVVHWYTHNGALLATDLVRSRPSVIGLDMTNEQNLFRLPYRDPTRFTASTGALALRLERRVYEAATLVLAKSAWAARSVMTRYGVPEDKTFVHAYGLRAAPPLPRLERERPLLVFVGRTLKRKGGWQLVDLWRRELRGRCDLALVTDQSLTPEEGLLVRNDIEVGDGLLEELFSSATALVHPSDMDSSPHVIFEAMAAGLPVIATTEGGMPEQVVDGRTGLIVPPHDDRALAHAISTLLDAPDRAAAMGQAGRDVFDRQFSMDVTVPKLIERLHEAHRRWPER